MRRLAGFSISVREEDFVLHLKVDGEDDIDLAVAPPEFEQIIDSLNELLAEAEGDDEDLNIDPDDTSDV